MSYTPLSLLLIILVIVIAPLFFTKHQKKVLLTAFALLFVFDVFVERGYFVEFGDIVLHYDEFLIAIFAPLFLFLLMKINYDAKVWKIYFGLLFSIAIGYFLVQFIPPDFKVVPLYASTDAIFAGRSELEYVYFNVEHIKKFIRILAYAPILLMASSNLIDYNKLLKMTVTIAKVFVCLLLFEFAAKSIGFVGLYDNFLQLIFNDGRTVIHERAGFFTLFGLTREPSHLQYMFMVPLFFIAVSKDKNNYILFFLMIVFMILSMSFSSFGAAVISLILFIYYVPIKINRLNVEYYMFIMLIVLVFTIIILLIHYGIIEYNLQRIYRFVTQDFHIGDDVRFWSIQENLTYFINRPLFGVGFGSTKAHAFIPSALANIGIVGGYLWFKLHKVALKIVRFKKVPTILMVIILLFSGSVVWLYSVNMIFILIVLTYSYKEKYNNMS